MMIMMMMTMMMMMMRWDTSPTSLCPVYLNNNTGIFTDTILYGDKGRNESIVPPKNIRQRPCMDN